MRRPVIPTIGGPPLTLAELRAHHAERLRHAEEAAGAGSSTQLPTPSQPGTRQAVADVTPVQAVPSGKAATE